MDRLARDGRPVTLVVAQYARKDSVGFFEPLKRLGARVIWRCFPACMSVSLFPMKSPKKSGRVVGKALAGRNLPMPGWKCVNNLLPSIHGCAIASTWARTPSSKPLWMKNCRWFALMKPWADALPGWKTDLTAMTEPGDLPVEARNYLAFLEDQVGCPVSLVGVGPGREQFVHRHVI